MDGTLTASTGTWHGVVIAEAVKRTGLKPNQEVTAGLAQQAYNGPGHGVDYFELLKENLFKKYFPRNTDEALKAFRKKLPEVAKDLRDANLYEAEITPLPGVLNFLRKLDRRGIEVAIVTMTPGYLAEAILHRAGLLDETTPGNLDVVLVKVIYGCELYTPDKSVDPELTRHNRYFQNRNQGLKKSNPLLWERALGTTFDDLDLSRCMVAEDGSQGISGAATLGIALLVVLNKSNLGDTEISKNTKLLVAEQEGDWTSLKEQED